ncbi:ECF transporter S component [Eubacteriales bacterium mix99]|jgi:ECF transporter S component (folate family)
MDKSSIRLRRIVISAVFLSISLVLKTAFSFQIPLFGQNGMSIGISGIFSILPSILFGPVYGAVTSGLSDLLGHFLKPMGPFIPLMTLIAAAGGWIRGCLWKILRNRDVRRMRIAVAVLSVLLLLFGICNMAFLSADGIDKSFYDRVRMDDIHTERMHLVSRLLVARTMNMKDPSGNLATYLFFTTSGLIGSAAFGILLLLLDLLISRKVRSNQGGGQTMPLLLAMIGSGLIVTTLNTMVMREMVYTSWKMLPFVVLWIPRVIEEILANIIKTYFVAVLLSALNRQRGIKEMVS